MIFKGPGIKVLNHITIIMIYRNPGFKGLNVVVCALEYCVPYDCKIFVGSKKYVLEFLVCCNIIIMITFNMWTVKGI